jgi:hypothetical protein
MHFEKSYNKDKHNPPKNVHADKGKEFYNKDMRIVLNKYNINLYSTGTKNKYRYLR